MNALRTAPNASQTENLSNQPARTRTQSRAPHRARDFGVGYGNSSGYASANGRRYAESWAKQPFSCW
jgi:hypothetical protein